MANYVQVMLTPDIHGPVKLNLWELFEDNFSQAPVTQQIGDFRIMRSKVDRVPAALHFAS